jgi:hypothetical protein
MLLAATNSLSPVAFYIFIALAALVSLVSAVYRQQQRQNTWQMAIDEAHRWATSIGGTVSQVSEEPAVYERLGRGMSTVVARRYCVTFTDRAGNECDVVFRYTPADDAWSVEQMTRNVAALSTSAPAPTLGDVAPDASSQASVPALDPEAAAAESYVRRHRGKQPNVRVIFAKPKLPTPPPRS